MKRTKMLVFTASALYMSLPVFADGSDSALGYAAIILAAPAVVAFVMMFAKLAQMKTAVKQNFADNYMKRETFKVEQADDIFLYSNTVKTPRPKSKN